MLISFTLYFHLQRLKGPNCRKKGEKKSKSLWYKIVSESTESAFCAKTILQKNYDVCLIRCKRVRFTLLFMCLSIQSSPEHSRLNALETPQLTLRATCKRT